MKKLATLAAIALLGLSAACAPSMGPNAAMNPGGKSAGQQATRWNAKAHCTRTGKRGYAYRQSTAADAAAAAIAMCIRRGGIPACCKVDELVAV